MWPQEGGGEKRKKGTIDSWTGAYIEIYRGVGGGMTDLGVTISLLNKKKMYIWFIRKVLPYPAPPSPLLERNWRGAIGTRAFDINRGTTHLTLGLRQCSLPIINICAPPLKITHLRPCSAPCVVCAPTVTRCAPWEHLLAMGALTLEVMLYDTPLQTHLFNI